MDSVYSPVSVNSNAELRIVSGYIEVGDMSTTEGKITVTENGNLSVFKTLRNSGAVVVEGRGATLFAEEYRGGQDVAFLELLNGAAANVQKLDTGSGNWSILVERSDLFVPSFHQRANGRTLVKDGGILTVGEYSISGFGSTLELDGGTVNGGSIRVSELGTIEARFGILPTVEVGSGGSLLTKEALSIKGDLLCSGGKLIVEVGGVGPGQYGFFDVSGAASFVPACTISFDFVDNFLPRQFENFDFLLANSIGGFDNLNYELIGATGAFEVIRVDNALQFLATEDFFQVSEPSSTSLLYVALLGLLPCYRVRNSWPGAGPSGRRASQASQP